MATHMEVVCGSNDGTAETNAPDAGGDADCDGENVIGEERSRGEKAGACAEIESRHGVRAAAIGIGGDGLEVGEVHDDKQRDDGDADRNEIANA